MLDLLYFRTADRVNKLRLKDYQKRFRKLLKSRDNRKRARIIGRSEDFQRGMRQSLKALRTECDRLKREAAREDNL